MSLNDKFTPDPLDRLLREYLLKQNPVGKNGESLMETAFQHQEITAVPPLEKENELVQKLKDEFAPQPEPMPGPASGGVQLAIFSGIAVALSITFFFLFLNQTSISPIAESPANSVSTHPEDGVEWVESGSENEYLPAMNDLAGTTDWVDNPVIDEDNDANPARKALSEKLRPGFSTGLGPQDVPANYPGNQIPNASQQNSLTANPLSDPFPLRDFYRQSTVKSQVFKVDNQVGKVFRANNGTLLHFPAFCFINPSGQPISGIVNVELKEVYKPYEFLLSNLPTVSNGRQLQGGGAIFLNADANGQPVAVAPSRKIYVEFAGQAESASSEMQIFQGSYNQQGEWNFVPSTQTQRATTMIALPLDQLGFEQFDCYCGKYWDGALYELTDPSFQETWIATREFKERIAAIRGLSEEVQYDMIELLHLYRDNTRMNLWQADRKAAEFLREKQKLGTGKSREYKDEVFEKLAAQMLTKVEPFEDFGLNFQDNDVRNQLLRKGVDEAEADRLIRVYVLTHQYLGSPEGGVFMSKDKKKRTPPKMSKFADTRIDTRHRDAKPGYYLNQLGWSSLASMSGPAFANAAANLDVHLRGSGPNHTASTYLVLAKQKSVLPAREIGSDEARFKDLPQNAQGYVVTIAYNNGQPWFGMKKITLKGTQKEEIQLAPADMENIIAQLKAIR